MQLKASTKSAIRMTDEQCQADKMPGLRGGRELRTTQLAKLVSTGRSWVSDWRGEVPARVNCYHGGRFCAGGRVTQATANAWCWMKESATRSWRRDLQMPVSSLFFTPVKESLPAFSYRSICRTGAGRGWLGLMSKTTISPHGAFSTGRVPVGRGQ